VGEWLPSPRRGSAEGGKTNVLMFIVYILYSDNFNRFYVGHTKNIVQRLKDHNRGNVRSTKAYVPWRVVYTEKYVTKSDAFCREMEIKSYKSGEAFRKLLQK
jgi:putative endonuclease